MKLLCHACLPALRTLPALLALHAPLAPLDPLALLAPLARFSAHSALVSVINSTVLNTDSSHVRPPPVAFGDTTLPGVRKKAVHTQSPPFHHYTQGHSSHADRPTAPFYRSPVFSVT